MNAPCVEDHKFNSVDQIHGFLEGRGIAEIRPKFEPGHAEKRDARSFSDGADQEARARRILTNLAEELGGEFHRDQITPDLIRLVTFQYTTPCGLETDRTITEEDRCFSAVEDGRVNIVASGAIRFDDPELLDSLRVIVHNSMVLESVERRPSPMFHTNEPVAWFGTASA